MAQSGNRIKRTVAAWLILASLLFLLSGVSPRAAEGTLGMVTHDSVNVRDAAGTVGTRVIAQLSTGHSVTILAETTVGSILWYQITASTSEGMITGWISGDYVRKITPDADYAASATTPTTISTGAMWTQTATSSAATATGGSPPPQTS